MDTYQKLRPSPPVPDAEMCRCADIQAAILMPHLTENPLTCMECKGEIPPERVHLEPDVAESLASWNHFFGAFETLWLDSGEYEEWARSELEDPASPVTVRGLELVRQLGAAPTYYLHLFQDTTRETWEAPTSCPRCGSAPARVLGWLVCETCRREIGGA